MKVFKSNFHIPKINPLEKSMREQIKPFDKKGIPKSLYQLKGRQGNKCYVLLDAGSKVDGAKELTLRKTYDLAKDKIKQKNVQQLFSPLIETERAKYSKGFHGTVSEFVSKLRNLIFRPEHRFKSTADLAQKLVETPRKHSRVKVALKHVVKKGADKVVDTDKIVALGEIKKKYGSDAKNIMKAVLKSGKVVSFEHVEGKKKDTFRFVMDSDMEGKVTQDGNTYTVIRAKEVVVEFKEKGGKLKIKFLEKRLKMKTETGWDKVLPEGVPGLIRGWAEKNKSASVPISHITIDKTEDIEDNKRVKLWIKSPIAILGTFDALTGSTEGFVNLFDSVFKK